MTAHDATFILYLSYIYFIFILHLFTFINKRKNIWKHYSPFFFTGFELVYFIFYESFDLRLIIVIHQIKKKFLIAAFDQLDQLDQLIDA